jgi:hypothetical protein
MNLDEMKYEVVIMHLDDSNERKTFDSLADAVAFMDEIDEPCVCLPLEPENTEPHG